MNIEGDRPASVGFDNERIPAAAGSIVFAVVGEAIVVLDELAGDEGVGGVRLVITVWGHLIYLLGSIGRC